MYVIYRIQYQGHRNSKNCYFGVSTKKSYKFYYFYLKKRYMTHRYDKNGDFAHPVFKLFSLRGVKYCNLVTIEEFKSKEEATEKLKHYINTVPCLNDKTKVKEAIKKETDKKPKKLKKQVLNERSNVITVYRENVKVDI